MTIFFLAAIALGTIAAYLAILRKIDSHLGDKGGSGA